MVLCNPDNFRSQPHARRVLLLDNHDSFTFNVVQSLRMQGAAVLVVENDRFDPAELTALDPSHVLISPGPGRPEHAGCTMALIAAAVAAGYPLLGICLGHQAIAAHFGAPVVAAKRLVHGKDSAVHHDRQGLFEGLPNPLRAARYHSLIVEAEQPLPEPLRITAFTSEGEIMGLRHTTLPVEGVQFHPESVLTPQGDTLLRNFLELRASDAAGAGRATA